MSLYVVPGGSVGICPEESDRRLCSANGGTVAVMPGDLLLVQHWITTAAAVSLEFVPDRCASAFEIESLPHHHQLFLAFLNLEPGVSSCPAEQDAWFIFHPETSGQIAVSVDSQSTFPHDLTVFESTNFTPGVCPPASDLLECNTQLKIFSVVAGQYYWFRVSRPNPGVMPEHPTALQLDWIDSVQNDECIDALPIAPGETASPELFVATASAPPACHTSGDAWYLLSPSISAPIRVRGTKRDRAS